ncbi:MAG: metal-dependent transcriptional regulator [Candidatus Izemoplasmatales bacterium]|nr:metal-dependent transcriptional regulator [Candidatus Izemoplasmatales bacterium]MDD5294234.1 metal-dependent transcriptional regulator [Candidatus Izemoplasmatales bacterium]
MTESNRFSESIEDYLEAIYVLGGKNVRSIAISRRLNVSRASVNRAVNTLIEKGLVTKKPYGEIYLTDIGMKASESVQKKHQILKRFLIEILGVEETTANKEACGIEHNISSETATKIDRLINEIKDKQSGSR